VSERTDGSPEDRAHKLELENTALRQAVDAHRTEMIFARGRAEGALEAVVRLAPELAVQAARGGKE